MILIASLQLEISVLSMDYMYMFESAMDRKKRKLDINSKDPEGMPILVMHDRWSKRIMAHVIREKGVHDYAVDRVAMEIRNLGYKRVILKSD